MQRGRFISFEGGEGAGKSTQITLLRQSLIDAGIQVVMTREPGGTDGAEAIRSLVVDGESDRWDPLSELFLMMAARQDHVRRLIGPSLDEGKWVICDRFYDSSRVYQGIAGALGLDLVDRFHEPILAEAKPDLTVLIDIGPEIGLSRRASALGAERFEAKGIEFHRRVRDGFRHLAQHEAERFLICDGTKTVQELAKDILSCLSSRFGLELAKDGR